MERLSLSLVLTILKVKNKVKGNHLASLIAQLVNHLPAMQETQVRFLGREDPLEKKMATHSNFSYSCLETTMDRESLAGYSPWSHKSRT